MVTLMGHFDALKFKLDLQSSGHFVFQLKDFMSGPVWLRKVLKFKP